MIIVWLTDYAYIRSNTFGRPHHHAAVSRDQALTGKAILHGWKCPAHAEEKV